ncbi:MAG: hypothetical protein HC843_03475 [Sphingomonadales bacterium]|nr:hypothetical protein [Sphingomonadales bacterium]
MNQLPYFTGAKIEDRLLITGAGQIGSIGAAALPLISEMQSRRCEDIADSAARFACDTKDDRLFSLAQDVAILTRTSESKLASGRSFDRHQQAIEACRSGDDETAKPGCIGEALTARRMALLPATAAPALAESAGFAVYLETTLDTAKPGAAAALEQMASVLAGTSNHVVLMRRTANGGDLQLRGAKRNAEGQKICQLRSDRAAFRGANLYKDITDRRQSGAITAYSFEDRLVMDLHSYTSAGGSEACTGTSAQSLVFIPIGGADFERLWSGLDSGSVLGSGPDR